MRLKTFPCLLILVHLLLILFAGYFLSPEFTLYPYLTSQGLKPYQTLIDHHLPIIFFGPLSLPAFLTVNPQPLLSLFLGLTALTDFLIYKLIQSLKVKKPSFWLTIFILLSLYFSGNTLWLETFTNLFLLSFLLLSKSRDDLIILLSGAFLSLTLLTRPTLLPALFLLILILKIKPSRHFLTGLAIPLLMSLYYLLANDLLPDFINLLINFNSQAYSILAVKAPSLKQIMITSLWFLPVLSLFLLKKQKLVLLTILLSFLPLYPRFDYLHLQPALILSIYFLLKLKSKIIYLYLPLVIIIFLSLYSIRLIRFRVGNFYLTPSTIKVIDFLNTTPEDEIYIFGGSDLIYPLAKKIPVNHYYLPSLPWYLNFPQFKKDQIQALKNNPQALVIINDQAKLDNNYYLNSQNPILEYIFTHYSKIHTIDSYQVLKYHP